MNLPSGLTGRRAASSSVNHCENRRPTGSFATRSGVWKILTFGELEAGASGFLAVFFPLLDPRISREKTCAFQHASV